MKTKFAQNAYRYFFIWGILSSLGMTVSTLIDALLVGNLIGSDGLAVANMSTPVFLTFALFGLTIGVGANVFIGRALGNYDAAEANRLFQTAIGVGLLFGAITLIPVLFFRDAFLRFLGVNADLFALAKQYLTIVMCFGPIFILYHILSVSVRTDSDPILPACSSAVVIVVNLVLDILFMKVFDWGIIGASSSLCIAESSGCLVLLTHFLKKKALLKLRVKLPKWKDIQQYIFNGFGMGSAYIFQALVMLIFNTLLMRSGQEMGVVYVAIFGVIYTVSMIPFAFFDGAANALSSVVAIFSGEQDSASIMDVRRLGQKSVLIAGTVMAVLCFVFAKWLALFFGLSGEAVMKSAESAIRLYAFSILFTGFNTLYTAFWQATGQAKRAGLMSLLRNFLLMLLIGSALISRRQITGLSLTYVAAEVVCALLVLAWMKKTNRYVVKAFSPSGRVFENHYIIQEQSVAQISTDLEALCDEWEIGMKQSFLINLIVEEMLLNIIKFGLQNNDEKYINVMIMEKGSDYIVRIRDNVNDYNPFESDGDEIDNGVLNLISKKTKLCDYQRKLIFNYLYLIV